MRKPQGPCQGCEDRTAEDPDKGTKDCHAKCEKYEAFREELREYQRKVYQERRAAIIAMHRPWMKQSSKAQKEYRREKEHDREE